MTLDEFTDYCSKNTDRLRRLAASKTPDGALAEDAVQQVWLNCVAHEGYESVCADTADRYFNTAVCNYLIDQHRRRKPVYGDELSEVADASSWAGDSASLAECERCVRAVLAKMSPRERQALRLSLSGMSRQQAIAEMGNGYDHALYDARATMREHLGQQQEVVHRLGLQRLLALLDEECGPPLNQS